MLLHLANLLLLGCYLVRDILLLRVAAIVASACFIAYFLMLEPIQVEAAAWNVVYVVVNAVQIGLIVRERAMGRLNARETSLRERVFPWMAPHKFARLVRSARVDRTTAERGAIVEQGASVPSLWLVEDGELEVIVDGARVATCVEGDFIGELAFVDSAPASATVKPVGACTLVTWDARALRALLDAEPEIERGVRAALGAGMSKKLRRRATDAIGSGLSAADA